LPSSERARRLARQLSWEESKVEELLNGLEKRRPQIVLAGPPGTGKTYCASAVARALLDDFEPPIDVESNIHVVQFHPTYSYQEFMEGLQPKPSGSSFMFDWVDGVLKRIVNRIESARKEGKPSRNILIIDEINRANVPSVLGELMYLLEYRNKSVTLGSGKSFTLPDDLIIIGTMNSADRSIRGLDLALRRRFDFFDVVPDARVLRDHFAADGRGKLVDMTIDQLVTGFDRLNQQIEIDSQSSDLMIGHSYLMEEVMSRQVLERVWRQQLFPLIREYFLGSADLIGKYSVDKFWNV
jgi:5-methylcytosine-specific restriction protein B